MSRTFDLKLRPSKLSNFSIVSMTSPSWYHVKNCLIFCYLRAFEPVIQHGICVLPDTHTHIHTHAYLSEVQKKTAYLEYWNFLDKNFTFVHFDKFLTEQNLFSSIFDLQLEKCIHCTHFSNMFSHFDIWTFEHGSMGSHFVQLGGGKKWMHHVYWHDRWWSFISAKKTVSA